MALRRILEECQTRQTEVIAVFVDFRKAVHSIAKDCILKILSVYNVPTKIVNAVCALYKNTKASVVTSDGPTEDFETTSGVLQGDSLSPFLFVVVMDWVIRTAIPDDSKGFLLERRRSSRYPEKRLPILAYADDLVLLASKVEAMQEMLDNLVIAASRVLKYLQSRRTLSYTSTTLTRRETNFAHIKRSVF